MESGGRPGDDARVAGTVDVLIVGSSCAGSLLAWGLARGGLSVAIVDRSRHPRPALGESTTPLGNLALERLARRFESRALFDLACWGRSQERHRELRRGLKRGFSFHLDRADAELDRLLVAASPNAELADQQWWRADVDQWLVGRAVAAGARLWQEVEIGTPRRVGERWLVPGRGRVDAAPTSWDAGFLVDASGAGTWLAQALDLPEGQRAEPEFEAHLLGGHFANADPVQSRTADVYPVSWGAVHRIVARGWMYQLRFDDGLLSAGFVGRQPLLRDGEDASRRFAELLREVPHLDAQFAGAASSGDLWSGSLIWRGSRAAGDGWAMLPQCYAFFGPLYSTGLAWSFLGVERLLDVLLDTTTVQRSQALADYEVLLAAEAGHIERLLACADRAFGTAIRQGHLDEVALATHLYFVAASWQETQQRLFNREERPSSRSQPGWAWDAFLGADDSVLRDAVCAFGEAQRDLRPLAPDVVARLLGGRDVGGFTSAPTKRQVGVSFETVVAACGLLGLSSDEVTARLPRLLGTPWDSSEL